MSKNTLKQHLSLLKARIDEIRKDIIFHLVELSKDGGFDLRSYKINVDRRDFDAHEQSRMQVLSVTQDHKGCLAILLSWGYENLLAEDELDVLGTDDLLTILEAVEDIKINEEHR